jgi:hypothetical protein
LLTCSEAGSDEPVGVVVVLLLVDDAVSFVWFPPQPVSRIDHTSTLNPINRRTRFML